MSSPVSELHIRSPIDPHLLLKMGAIHEQLTSTTTAVSYSIGTGIVGKIVYINYVRGHNASRWSSGGILYYPNAKDTSTSYQIWSPDGGNTTPPSLNKYSQASDLFPMILRGDGLVQLSDIYGYETTDTIRYDADIYLIDERVYDNIMKEVYGI